MKKSKLLAIINEAMARGVEFNINDDSFYDGHKFVEYGKNIPVVRNVNEESLVVTWGVKFQFRNSGIEGVQIAVLSLEGKINGENVNFAEYKINVFKEPNPEIKDIQIYIESVEVNVEQRTVDVIVNI
jgi:hypothetical protein